MTVDIFIHQFIFWNVIVKQATDVWVLNKTIHIDDTESVLTGIIGIFLRTYRCNLCKVTCLAKRGISCSLCTILHPCIHCHQKNLYSE